MERLTSWMHWDGPTESLPPDLTPIGGVAVCGEWWGTRHCTRRAGHTGRHAAGTGERIVAVWPRKVSSPAMPDWYDWAAEEATWD